MNRKNILNSLSCLRQKQGVNSMASAVACLRVSWVHNVSPRSGPLSSPIELWSSCQRFPGYSWLTPSCSENEWTAHPWSPFELFSGWRAVASSSCAELHGNGRRRQLGMKEGTSVPRVLLTADPTHCSSVSHPFVSAYCRFAYTHTYNLIHTPIRTRAGLRSYDSAVRTLPFHTISKLITL